MRRLIALALGALAAACTPLPEKVEQTRAGRDLYWKYEDNAPGWLSLVKREWSLQGLPDHAVLSLQCRDDGALLVMPYDFIAYTDGGSGSTDPDGYRRLLLQMGNRRMEGVLAVVGGPYSGGFTGEIASGAGRVGKLGGQILRVAVLYEGDERSDANYDHEAYYAGPDPDRMKAFQDYCEAQGVTAGEE